MHLMYRYSKTPGAEPGEDEKETVSQKWDIRRHKLSQYNTLARADER